MMPLVSATTPYELYQHELPKLGTTPSVYELEQVALQTGGKSDYHNGVTLVAIPNSPMVDVVLGTTVSIEILTYNGVEPENLTTNATILGLKKPLNIPLYYREQGHYKIDIPTNSVGVGTFSVGIASEQGTVVKLSFTVVEEPIITEEEETPASLWPIIGIVLFAIVITLIAWRLNTK